MHGDTNHIYEFGPFRLDVREHTLTNGDDSKNIPLPEKAFQTLCLLIQRRGQLLTKQELLAEIWPNSFVEENNLDKCIHAIRQVLGEKPGEQRYIETVRKHGYRFVAAVNIIETTQEGVESVLDGKLLDEWKARTSLAKPVISTSTTESGAFVVKAKWPTEDAEKKVAPQIVIGDDIFSYAERKTTPVSPGTLWNRKPALFAGAIVLATALVSGYLLYSGKSTSGGTKEFAVLPVQPIDRSNRSDIYEIGIADALIQRLSSISGFVVRPLSATRRYSDVEQDPIAAGSEQKVDYILASNYQLSGGRIKITTQLINVETGTVEESYKFESEALSVFAVQDAVASDLAEKLMARFGAPAPGRVPKRGTTSVQAYQLYVQAFSLTDRRTREDMLKAVQYLDQALQIDPNYAPAWARKALAHRYIDKPSATENYHRSIDAINRALAIDPDLSEAYSALCDNKFNYEYDSVGAEAACKRAIELDPNSSIAHQTNAHFMSSRGRLEESLAEVETAINLDPTSYFNRRYYANGFYLARRYDEAVAQYKQLIERDPTNIGTYNWIIRALEAQGNEAEAFEWFIRSLTLQEQSGATIDRFQNAYQISGWQGVLLERIKTPEADRGSGNPFRVAGLYARVGDRDKAFEYLESCYQERNPFITLLAYEPQFDSIRNDPRYTDLIRRLNGN